MDNRPFIRGRDESKKGMNDGQKWFLEPTPIRSRTTNENIFIVPTNKVPNTRGKDTPEEIFDLFLDEKMKKDIIKFTNEQGRLKKGENWSLMDMLELEDLIGSFGAQKQSKTSTLVLWTELIGQDLVSSNLSLTCVSTRKRPREPAC